MGPCAPKACHAYTPQPSAEGFELKLSAAGATFRAFWAPGPRPSSQLEVAPPCKAAGASFRAPGAEPASEPWLEVALLAQFSGQGFPPHLGSRALGRAPARGRSPGPKPHGHQGGRILAGGTARFRRFPLGKQSWGGWPPMPAPRQHDPPFATLCASALHRARPHLCRLPSFLLESLKCLTVDPHNLRPGPSQPGLLPAGSAPSRSTS